MTDSIQEQVSAFMDGELEDEASELLVRRLCKDEAMRERAFGYSLAGAAMRDELALDAALLRHRVATALDAAPTAEPEPVPEPSAGWRPLRAIAGIGIAATVGVAALLTVQQSPDTSLTQAPQAAVAEAPISYIVPPESESLLPAAQPPVRLTNYFVNHSHYASTLGRQSLQTGLLSRQVRFEVEPSVTSENESRQD